MGLFDRDTDMSDDEPSDADADDPTFDPVEGTAPSGDGGDAGGGGAEGDDGESSAFDRLEAVRLRDDDFNGTLKRAVDREAGVVLYAYGNGNAGGLAAVPLAQTEFDRE